MLNILETGRQVWFFFFSVLSRAVGAHSWWGAYSGKAYVPRPRPGHVSFFVMIMIHSHRWWWCHSETESDYECDGIAMGRIEETQMSAKRTCTYASTYAQYTYTPPANEALLGKPGNVKI